MNPASVGALVREHREAAALTQTQLAERIGASRFWVAAFEKGKPSAELGLALKAIQAVGLTLQIGPDRNAAVEQAPSEKSALLRHTHNTSLENVIAHATLTHAARTSVVGWPIAKTTRANPTPPIAKPKRKA